MSEEANSDGRRREAWREWRLDLLALASLGLLAAYFVAFSWRKWPDPIIDFGRELYLPWRISEGAVFGRDVESLYGPLSAHLNAVVFALTGPGIMYLVAFNLVIYALILGLSYFLLKQGWGRAGACLGCAVFVSLFSFSQFTGIGNYSYAAPYAHEATHGLLACLAQVLALLRWREKGTSSWAAIAGLCLGLTAVLKVECLIVAGAVTAVVGLMRWCERRKIDGGELTIFFGAAALPMLVFALFFACHMPWLEAIETAGQAVLNSVPSSRLLAEKVQLSFSGFDQPWLHLKQHLGATASAAVLVTAIFSGARLAGREIESSSGWRWLGWSLGVILVLGVGWFSWSCVTLTGGPGHALMGFTTFAVGVAVWDWEKLRRSGKRNAAVEARLLIGVLGVTMMLRMALSGRIYHYGFYQAAVAAMVVTATLLADWPVRMAGNRHGRLFAIAVALALIIPGTTCLALISIRNYSWRTLEVGRGADRMSCFPPEKNAGGEMVRMAVGLGDRIVAPGERLLVLPEGIMINYLMRRLTPLRTAHFFAGALYDGREAAVVEQLKRSPPEWVLLLSRDLREYGVDRYGESPGHGEFLLRWMLANYSLEARTGADPLDPNKYGARYYKRMPHPASGDVSVR